ncbi:MAG: hypothetical protein RsTaC01_0940 [Candidatus Paraimprobicoccus trichonymphae]|uniref:Uncharacterized protein n=1 Tax=Candidatus Paraimprobicoccus trichonymphae TaxID=3033793 RepID=A0AA48HX24_9FIRM|nr:MAG: hypothetical protein RsTaC01_0940 [Candidatus Paraimprobicoccus trichonymphae]
MEENKIVKLAKNGELTEKLMQDKDFVRRAKDILKKENTDENEIFEILKTLEKCINKSGEIKNKEDLENTVGGKISKVGELAIETTFSLLGTTAGFVFGANVGEFAATSGKVNKIFGENLNTDHILIGGAIAGAVAGNLGGLALGKLIVNKINK